MKQISLSDFSGGYKTAFSAEDFEANQWAQLKGFILVKPTVMRSQPPLQRVGSEAGFREIRPLVAADGTQFLIGIKDNGELWRCAVPAVSATFSTVNAATWTRLTSSNGTATITVGVDAHFLTDIVFQQSTIAGGRRIPALLINQAYTTGASSEGPVYVWADTSSSIGCWRVIDGAGNPAVYPGYLPVAPSNVIATLPTGSVTAYERAGTTATLTVGTHNFLSGDIVVVSGVIAALTGTYTLTGVTATTISYTTVTSDTVPSTATTGNVAAISGTITVTWTPENAGSSAITGYKVYSKNGVQKATALASATSATFSGTADDAVGIVVRASNSYGETPFDAGGGVRVPSIGYIPRANVGALWNGQLILGDIEYYRDENDIGKDIPLSSTNSARIRNGVWFSNPDAVSQFHPLAQFTIGQPDSQITGMVVVPQGLMVFTKTISNDSGVFLLRGTSAGVILDDELALNFTQELIRGGIGTRGFANAGGAFNHIKSWASTGTVAFLDENSLVWQTNTQGVTQINEDIQLVQTSYANTSDNLAAWDKYLLFGTANRLDVLREFGESGGWTEFVLPDTTYTAGIAGPVSLQEMGNCVYFIWHDGTNKQVWRYNMQPTGTAVAEFGKINGRSVDLTIATRPVRGSTGPHEKTFWHRIGLRFRGTNTFAIKSITSAPAYAQGAFAIPGTYTITNSPPTAYPPPANFRGEKVYPAHGPSIECQAIIVVQGSAEIESVTLYAHGKKPNRP